MVVKFADNKKALGGRSGPVLEQQSLYGPPMSGGAAHHLHVSSPANNWMNMNMTTNANRGSQFYGQPPQSHHSMRVVAGSQSNQSSNQLLQGMGMSMHIVNQQQQQPMGQFMPIPPYMQYQAGVAADPRTGSAQMTQTQHIAQQRHPAVGDPRSMGFVPQHQLSPQRAVGPRSGSYYNTQMTIEGTPHQQATAGAQYRYTQAVGNSHPSATTGGNGNVASAENSQIRANEATILRPPALQMNVISGDATLHHRPNISNNIVDSNADNQLKRPPEGMQFYLINSPSSNSHRITDSTFRFMWIPSAILLFLNARAHRSKSVHLPPSSRLNRCRLGNFIRNIRKCNFSKSLR